MALLSFYIGILPSNLNIYVEVINVCILDYIFEFNAKYNSILSTIDGVNGDCSVYSYLLYEYFKLKGESVEIYMLNKGVHFWIKVKDFYIDCRNIFSSEDKIIKSFLKYIVKVRVQSISIDYLKKYILKNKPTFAYLFK